MSRLLALVAVVLVGASIAYAADEAQEAAAKEKEAAAAKEKEASATAVAEAKKKAAAAKKAKKAKKEAEPKEEEDPDKVDWSKVDWGKRLTRAQYNVLRQAGTERAFRGKYWNFFEDGEYHCAGCGLPLFESTAKFESDCGWPSFDKTLAKDSVTEHEDLTLFQPRVEIRCKRCGSHLGHVFNDGPTETGQRYCLNSVAMNFVPSEELEKQREKAAAEKEKSADSDKEKSAEPKKEESAVAKEDGDAKEIDAEKEEAAVETTEKSDEDGAKK